MPWVEKQSPFRARTATTINPPFHRKGIKKGPGIYLGGLVMTLLGSDSQTPFSCLRRRRNLDDGAGVAGDTGPQVGALLGHGAVDGGT